ncbi:uncharacterized protein [Parasteatoda tepidariorum]
MNEIDIQQPPLAYTASVFAVKNKRRKMEDRHVIHHDLNLLLNLKDCPPHSYYAVFDGHSGVDAASYASAHLHVNIANHPDFLTDTPTAITEAYKITDQNFSNKCFQENLKSGTTAVCALFRERTFYLSWVGDSQAVLVKEGIPAIVTSPHKPDREDEKKRVEDLGGSIQFIGTYRVNGMLAVTRAIGDADHKPFISSEPEITVVNLEGNEDFLILACDGVWDVMSPEDVVAALYYNLLENGQDDPFDTMAAKLVHQSKLQGSEDNITAVVIFLRDIQLIKEAAQKYIPNLSKANFQMNFFENGEEKSLIDKVTSTPICKPNVLEFNYSSIKKLKNTANVLSAAGLGDSFTDYVETYHASNFEKLSEKPVHTVVAPEATALSELPTPPIDDVMASQQFENICSANLAQKFELVSPSTNSPFEDFKDQKTAEIISENDKNILLNEELSPEEAVDIASTVVSNAIETAVKCISEKEFNETKVHMSPQKLNPYAEPFVMKSFIPSETVECNLVNICPSASDLTSVMGNTGLTFNKEKELIMSETISTETKDNIEPTTCSSSIIEKAQVSVNELTLASTDLDGATKLPVPAKSEMRSENLSLIADMDISLVNNSAFGEFDTPENKNLLIKEDLRMNRSSQQIIDNFVNTELKENISAQNLFDVLKTEENKTEESIIEVFSQDIVIEVSDEKSPLGEFLEIENASSNENDKDFLKHGDEDVCNSEISLIQNTQNIELIDISSDIVNNDLLDLKTGCIGTDIPVESNSIVNELCVTESSPVTDSSSVSIHDDQVRREPPKSDIKEENAVQLPDDKKPEVALILGGVSLPLVDDTAAAVLPTDHSEECHVETVAVDLQSVPVGVPEAEGVTEDVDSDSEKDGGWSYMKGNAAGEKNKSSEKSSKQETPKLKRDAQKSTDIKSKVKSTVGVEKNKKLLAEKKPLEVRSKLSKPTSTIASKTTDKAKVPITGTSTTAKKLIPAAKNTIPSSKMSRPTTVPRNAPTQNKSGVTSSVSRIQTSTKPASAINTKVKPNNGVSTTSTHTTSSLIRKQPSTQSNKTSTLSSARTTLNRPATATVPNRALSATKSTTLPKSSFESKPKQTSTTLRQTVSSTLKKPEIKETKELSNKQLSEKNSPLPKIPSKGISSNVNSTLKSSASGISKTAPKPNVPSKRELIKNVPKTQISRLAPRNNSQVKPTRDLAKPVATDSTKLTTKHLPSFSKKAIQKTNQIVEADDKNTNESTPSEEEKLLREVNDVEISTKELADCATTDAVHEKTPMENGCNSEEEEKVVKDEPTPNPVESLL